MRFRDALAAEFSRRRQLNPRYSLRGFARAVGTHHATLSRLLRGTPDGDTMAVLRDPTGVTFGVMLRRT